MKRLIDSDGHATRAAIRAFAAGRLNPEELDEVSEHVAGCGLCARALAGEIEKGPPVPVPAGFEEEILGRLSPPRGSRAELLRFSFRVVLAACLALFFVFSSAMTAAAGARSPLAEIKAPGFSTVETINTRLRDFSQRLLKMEAFQDAEKTK